MKRHIHLNVHSSAVYSNQDMETMKVSNKWMDKEDPYIKGERYVCVCVCVCVVTQPHNGMEYSSVFVFFF